MKNINIIAEIGINHDGQYEIAEALLVAAANSGVNGVKFQYRNLDNAYADRASEIGDEIISNEIKKNYLSPKSIVKLIEKGHELNIQVGISFFEQMDILDFADDIERFDFFKIPSVELSNTALINSLLDFDKPVYVSLGCHSEVEIDLALAQLKGRQWIPLHCVSNYPLSIFNAKLGYLDYLKNKWSRDFGYSSHDENWEVCLIAMAKGATTIERHITFDKSALGLDHSTSSTPEEFKRITFFAENMKFILAGNAARIPNQGELLNLQNLGRSYYSKVDIHPDELVTYDQLVLRSPRVGMDRSEIGKYIGRHPIKSIKAGDVLNLSVFEKNAKISVGAIEFAKSKKIGLPVRLHDYGLMKAQFPVNVFEFHLSFGELQSSLNTSDFDKSDLYSIHLPDYINSRQLMDPFSLDQEQARDSKVILQRTVDFAMALQDLTGRDVPIVGSFSVVHENLAQFYEQHNALLSGYRDKGALIMPQWLPPVAWYFGGSVQLHAMNHKRDVDYILRHQMPICMDICHLCMGANLGDMDRLTMIETLKNNIKHLHLADANGIDGEGLHFGEGDPENLPALAAAIEYDCLKIIEVWQGHLNHGAGFAKGLESLYHLFGS
ncbi:N-acetylneuraminate synthase family protein [Polynucleobacter sp. AP-Titi-500A-B4]|uniref:N-acetylneuraminate synthase family protein n=1 Tax=Polynucleobacter sp. AP-Titi-500A-B4 TaxID=2576923 RepID=UPI001BFE0D94|nr:N-acetylneuraminate synthase family protein [Polynucleobacter sp. AP-Titi-500A-B4]QWE12798.1 N-acetylneuraminate synthase family protein [Polynucleobacter sp. AP-Titi-500A-B4]